jgi:hypothetical protein
MTDHPNPERVQQHIVAIRDAIAQALDLHPPRVQDAYDLFVRYRGAVKEIFDELPALEVEKYAKMAHRVAAEVQVHRDQMASPAQAASQVYSWAARAYDKLAELADREQPGSVAALMHHRQARVMETRASLAIAAVEHHQYLR